MKIQPTNYSFKSKPEYNISKKKLITPAIKQAEEASISTIAAATSALAINEIIKNFGLTFCDVKDNTVHTGAGYNGGYYTVKFDKTIQPNAVKAYFAHTLFVEKQAALGGLMNYKAMTEDLKRQDIIEKGLLLHTYELNTKVPKEHADVAAACLSKMAKKYIKAKDLFFIDTEAFYYDKLDKTAYSVDAYVKSYSKKNPTFRVCTFKTDANGNAIGYSTKAMDLFRQQQIEKVYQEQQQVSEELPEIANLDNNKSLAESFRFGNTKTPKYRIKQVFPNVLDHLSKRVGVKNPTEDKLQIIRFYDKDKNVISRIGYYDPTIGRSLIYNEEGKYIYQMAYNKDAEGNIVSCSKF